MTDHHHSEEQGGDLLDRGLRFDLAYLRDRRTVLSLLGAGALGTGGALLLGSGTPASAATCSGSEIPAETAGPYPGDGSNGPNVLDDSGVVRRDIRRSFGDTHRRAQGIDLTLTLRLVSTGDCDPLEGYAVYAWHCDAKGRYSMYSAGVTDQNWLRGVQVSGEKGIVRFRSVLPGCYPGRWPHVHFEVYRSKRAATRSGTPVATSQLALPRKVAAHVYGKRPRLYGDSATNLDQISLSSDNVFGDDGGVDQLARVKGTLRRGYRAYLQVPIDV
ncbi:dioxygenase family protein [Nocardioides bruguierae]|uniref:3,4-dioxygenase subunit beta n=1 Tax=Nocardioides bruguierae TaxID=2945102 RepID=A0A9X2DAK1_9ACTN|nr:3,4-dioxygenase subunit beta [Nocardioides bruguierae]MCM0622362.1 3,4-dioxygenase subunit beta [Nocardioides bruguierae]